LEQSSKLFNLVGLSDYDEALASSDMSKYTIVLRIETFEEESLCKYFTRHESLYLITWTNPDVFCRLDLQQARKNEHGRQRVSE
jgi:hypothetical protein